MKPRPTSPAWSKRPARAAEIVIARAGKPVARLVSMQAPARRRKLGVLAGKLVVPRNFDAPLPDDVVAAFEGEADAAAR